MPGVHLRRVCAVRRVRVLRRLGLVERERLRRSLLHAFLCGESMPGRRMRSESGGRLKLQLSSEQRVRRG